MAAIHDLASSTILALFLCAALGGCGSEGEAGLTGTGGGAGGAGHGGSAGSTSTGGAAGSVALGGSAGSTSKGGAAGSAGLAGSAGSTSTGGGAGGPSVSWQVPTNGGVVAGQLNETNQNCIVNASSPVGVDNVQFFLDGSTNALNTETSFPYCCSWNTATAANGPHTLTAVVTDKNSAVSSAQISVHVQNTGGSGGSGGSAGAAGNANSCAAGEGHAYVVSTTAQLTSLNNTQLVPCDVVTIDSFVDGTLKTTHPMNGAVNKPITVQGKPGAGGVHSISLTQARYVNFEDLEVKGSGSDLLVTAKGSLVVRDLSFTRLHIHQGLTGVDLGSKNDGKNISDLKFIDTTVENTELDGYCTEDMAGDRVAILGGVIRHTGTKGMSSQYPYHAHGFYASGGHGHVVDGVYFEDIQNQGWSVSIRRGNMTVRNCTFNTTQGVGLVNEDKASEGGGGLLYYIYRNVFVGGGTAIYHGDNLAVPYGDDCPGNTWAIFNNTFVNAALNIPSTASSHAACYDVYVKNNIFSGGHITVVAPSAGHVHDVSYNGFFGNVTGDKGANPITGQGDPGLDANHKVTNTSYADRGVVTIVPNQVSMIQDVAPALEPFGFWGLSPDLGHTEMK